MDRLLEIPSGFGLWLELNEAFLPILLFMIFQSASKILQNFEYDGEKFGKNWEEKSLVRLAANPFFGWYWNMPKTYTSVLPLNADGRRHNATASQKS